VSFEMPSLGVPHSLIAIELCLRLAPGSAPRTRLHQIVAQHPAATSRDAKWKMLAEASRILHGNLDQAVRGCWDFFDEDARARRDFEMWSQGMITREGARTAPHQQSAYRGGEPLHYTFTIAILMKRGTSAERRIAGSLDVPEHALWHRATFARVLSTIGLVSYASVHADVLYLIPGDEAWGLSNGDLEAPKFHYLRPIVG
jgi:hypothetical protein